VVVTRDARGQLESHWLAATVAGPEIVHRRPGAFIAVDREVWEWQVERVERPLPGCGTNAAETGQRARLESVVMKRDDGHRRVFAEAETLPEQPLRRYDQRVTLVGVVGPVLVARAQLVTDGCGAHGSMATRSVTYDLRRRQPRRLLDSANDSEDYSRSLEQAVKALQRAAGDAEVPIVEDDVELRAVEPRHRPGRGIRLNYIFSADVCYACGDGVWEDYTRSTEVEARSVPDDLAPHLGPNEAVEAFAAASPDLTILGWSELAD
jgi:hypothetical protein